MSKPSPKRPPSTRKRMILMLIAAIVVFGGVFGIKALIGAQTNKFFDNMPQPAAAVSTASCGGCCCALLIRANAASLC